MTEKTENVLQKLKEKFQQKNMENITQDNIQDIHQVKKKGDELWRVGIICKKDPYFLAHEILKCLEKNGYEWKIISSSYKIKCRKKRSDSEKEINPNALNVLIQIFGNVDPKEKDEYLIDLHKLSGGIMEFLEFSSNFLSTIQSANLIVLK
jgi:hypothetical protein